MQAVAAVDSSRVPTRDHAPDERARLRALAELEILDTPPEERFDRVTRLAQRLFGVPMAHISFMDENRNWMKSAVGLDVPQVPREISFCNTTIQQGGTFVVPDAAEDARFRDNPLVTGDPGIRFYAGHPLEAVGGERVGTLCLLDNRPREFSDAERELLEDLALWVEKEMTLREELDRAAEVQRALLPRTLPDVDGYDVAARCIPSRAVGGDFYDWYTVADGLELTVADVMGKGMGAAILMATVRAVLRSAARRDDVAAAVAHAATTLEPDLDETGTFVTLLHGRLNGATGEFRYADAGHGLMLVVRAGGEAERPLTPGLPLGALAGEQWEEHVIRLDPGDTLLVFSDGLLDLYDGSLEALDDFVAMARAVEGVQDIVDHISALARRSTPPDDVTLVAIRRDAE
jgi:serine phosphatase RsbU (regulator of sigma subunit)